MRKCRPPVILAMTLVTFGELAAVSAHGQELTRSQAALKRTNPAVCRKVDAARVQIGDENFRPVGLSFVRGHVRGRVPVVLVHGLWGSPRNWTRMLSALETDPFVDSRFQFLTFGYSGGGPITHVASQLRNELRTLRDRLDPEHSDSAWDRMVLVGHSLGGILSKMMAQRSGSKLWDLTTDRPVDELAGPVDARDLLRRELVYEPVTEVRRVIFIAAPHRGSRLACKPIKDIEGRLVQTPAPLQQARAQLLAFNGPCASRRRFERVYRRVSIRSRGNILSCWPSTDYRQIER